MTASARLLLVLSLIALSSSFARCDDETPAGVSADAPVSYHRQIRPILQTQCHGCHQPAKAGGDYVMTTYRQLLAGGESETAAVLAGKADDSYLVELITPVSPAATSRSPRPMPPDWSACSDEASRRSWLDSKGSTPPRP